MPTVVRLLEFPETVRLTKRRGGGYQSRSFESGATILCEREGTAVLRLHLSEGVEFASGGTEITRTERFADGEHRDILIPWTLAVDDTSRRGKFLLELDVSYQDGSEVHTATAPVKLVYPSTTTKAAIAVGTIAAAATAVAVASSRRKKEASRVRAEDIPDEIELAVIDVPQPRRTSAPAPKQGAKKSAAKRASAKPSSRNTGSRKSAAQKSSSRKSSGTKSSARPSAGKSSTKKSAAKSSPAKKSSASRKSSSRKSTASRSSRR